VIGTLALREAAKGHDVWIVSGDKDMTQLVGARVRLYNVQRPNAGEVDLVDAAKVVDVLGLMGDASDNVPGVPGIGEKTAARLIAAHGSLANVLAAKTLPPAVARRLAAAEPYLAAARRVVPPVAEVRLPPLDLALPKAPRHPRTLARLAREHELATPVGRVEKALAAVGRA